MELFCVKPKVHMVDTFAEFAEEFSLCETDLLLTEQIMYDLFAKPLQLPCHLILKDTYDRGEPNDETIDRILLDIKDWDIKRIIAMGGGSVIDIGKILTIKDCYPVDDVINGKTARIPEKDLVILPTTCGTGSEVTYGGIVTVKATGLKMAIIDERLTASHAVLIPELIAGLPYKIFVHCSVDALAHSMEAFVSATRGNEFARAVGARSISLLLEGYVDIYLNGPDYRQKLLKNYSIASCLGGMAVNNGGAGPVHALAYPLGEKYKMSHGESIYQFLGPVFNLYRQHSDGAVLQELTALIDKPLRRAGLFTAASESFSQMEALLHSICPLRSLGEAGMTQADVEPFVENIFANKQRLLAASYIPFTPEMAKAIYLERL